MNNRTIHQEITQSRDDYSRQCVLIVHSYYDLVDAGDSEFLELFHPNATYKRPGYGLLSGHEELSHFYAATRIISHGRHSPRNFFADGARVAVEGVFEGILRDGSHVTVLFSDFFHFDGSDSPPRILIRRTYFDDVKV